MKEQQDSAVDVGHRRCGFGLALDAASDCEMGLRHAGLHTAATYVHDAHHSLKLAQSLIAIRENGNVAPSRSFPGSIEELITEDGRRLGVYLAGVKGPVGCLAHLRSGEIELEQSIQLALPAYPSPDLGWDLMRAPASAAFVEDDLFAALLLRALSHTAWIGTNQHARWTASQGAAFAIVRILRAGQPVAPLRSPAGALLDIRVVELLAGLGWRPEPVRQRGHEFPALKRSDHA